MINGLYRIDHTCSTTNFHFLYITFLQTFSTTHLHGHTQNLGRFDKICTLHIHYIAS